MNARSLFSAQHRAASAAALAAPPRRARPTPIPWRLRHRVPLPSSPWSWSSPARRVYSSSAAGQDYYALLGIDRNASQADVKKAFFTMAKKYHPDTNKSPEAQKRFVEISQAYETLKDPVKKSQYDSMLRFGGASGGPSASSGGYGGYGGYSSRPQGNTYARASYGPRGPTREDFMGWYGQHFGDILREFERFAREEAEAARRHGSGGTQWRKTTIQFGPDGRVRVRTQSNRGDTVHERTFGSRPRAESYQQTRGGGFSEYMRQSDRIRRMMNDPLGTIFGGLGFDDDDRPTVMDFPSNFNIMLHDRPTSDGLASFQLYAGRKFIGHIIEKSYSERNGSVLHYEYDGKLVAKARVWKASGLESMIIEDADSVKIGSIQEVPRGGGLLSLVRTRYAIRGPKDDLIGALSSVDAGIHNINFRDRTGRTVASAAGTAILFGAAALHDYDVQIHNDCYFDAALIMFPLAARLLARQKKPSLVQSAINVITGMLGKGKDEKKR